MSAPHADRPAIRDYGIPETDDGLLPWSWAETHLRDSLVYWISTVRPDGRPHAVPTWAVWVDAALWFEGGTGTRHARNLAENPNAVASIQVDDDAALIVEGIVELRRDPGAALERRLLDGFGKYLATRFEYRADPANWSLERGGGLWMLRPSLALGWTRFPDDATRWRFVPEPPSRRTRARAVR